MKEQREKISFREKLCFDEDVLAALKLLNSVSEACGTKIVLKGGVIRDQLARFYHGVNLDSKDYDLFVLDRINLVMGELIKKGGKLIERRRRKGTSAFKFLLPDLVKDAKFELGVLLGGDAYGKTIDFNQVIENDARRTDFDVNAISLDLSTLTSGSGYRIYDPLNGEEAIKNRVISVVSPTSFYHNPENILRGIKIADRLQANLSNQTLQSIERYAPRLQRIPRDFLLANLAPIVESPNSEDLWVLMEKLGVIKAIFPSQEG